MVKAAAMKNWINEKDIVLETLLSFKRAGAKGRRAKCKRAKGTLKLKILSIFCVGGRSFLV